MTIEEKAKAYDEALERARNLENTTPEEEALINYIFLELSESEDDRIRKMIENTLRDAVLYERISETSYREMLTYLEKQKEQKPAEWSEEDETCLENALWCVTKTRHFVAKDACDLDACRCAENWLKALRPPLKDRDMKLKILKYLSTRCSSLEFEEVEDYLNNLRTQPHWKPSEEQIYSLGTVVKGIDHVSVGSVGYNLKELYEQLKKL